MLTPYPNIDGTCTVMTFQNIDVYIVGSKYYNMYVMQKLTYSFACNFFPFWMVTNKMVIGGLHVLVVTLSNKLRSPLNNHHFER